MPLTSGMSLVNASDGNVVADLPAERLTLCPRAGEYVNYVSQDTGKCIAGVVLRVEHNFACDGTDGHHQVDIVIDPEPAA